MLCRVLKSVSKSLTLGGLGIAAVGLTIYAIYGPGAAVPTFAGG